MEFGYIQIIREDIKLLSQENIYGALEEMMTQMMLLCITVVEQGPSYSTVQHTHFIMVLILPLFHRKFGIMEIG
jgi:hypothetical protein